MGVNSDAVCLRASRGLGMILEQVCRKTAVHEGDSNPGIQFLLLSLWFACQEDLLYRNPLQVIQTVCAIGTH